MDTSQIRYFEEKRQRAVASVRKYKRRVREAKELVKTAHYVRNLVQSVSLSIQEDMHQKIDAVVTRCLQVVFPNPYEFKIVFEKKRGQTQARLAFTRKGEEFDPLNECGGGVIDVACLGLRLATLLLRKPKPAPILFLDEPFRYLDKDSPGRVVRLLETLAVEFGIQIVMVTHNPELVSGKVIQL